MVKMSTLYPSDNKVKHVNNANKYQYFIQVSKRVKIQHYTQVDENI